MKAVHNDTATASLGFAQGMSDRWLQYIADGLETLQRNAGNSRVPWSSSLSDAESE